ncbi:MAG: gfo/Idh/MocA family oxidoreductase, partial [Planctomycetales bacterium]|nr:gfo/Idh/MocA family oxidoreductase [Planctomycetales bacterium]
VMLKWYDGYRGADRKKDPQNFPPAALLEGEDPSKFGSLLVGEKGKFFFNRDNMNWVIKSEGTGEDFREPEKTLPRVANEDEEWVAACKGGPAALSNFAYAGPFTETVLLGNVAIRVGKKLQWDAKKLRCPNASEADQFLRRAYRKGWELS